MGHDYKYDLYIDPGHGGKDPGANGYGVNEKDWTLKISLYQYERLKELGVKVAITRTTDNTLDTGPRTALIKNKAHYCMSNHFNAASSNARGVEVIHSVWTHDKLARRFANAICEVSDLPFRRVFSRQADWTKNKLDYYFIPRETGNTESLIVEYGFIDNKQDNAYYKNEDNFYKVAERVVKEWCAVLGKKYVAPGEKKTNSITKPKVQTKAQTISKTDTKKYRLKTGIFKTAKDLADAKVKLKNLRSWLVYERADSTDYNPNYRLYTGTFTGKANAEKAAAELQKDTGWKIYVIEA
jgi:N-acetylmuramoyl-L-alanine amidase